jgi:hypothetical protein
VVEAKSNVLGRMVATTSRVRNGCTMFGNKIPVKQKALSHKILAADVRSGIAGTGTMS